MLVSRKMAAKKLAKVTIPMDLIAALEHWVVEAHVRRDGIENQDYKARAELEEARVQLTRYIGRVQNHTPPEVRAEMKTTRARLQRVERELEKARGRVDRMRDAVSNSKRERDDACEALAALRQKKNEPRRHIFAEGFREGQMTALDRLLVGSCPIKGCSVPLPSLFEIVKAASLVTHAAQNHIRSPA